MPTSHHKNWRPCQSQLSMYVRHCSSWDVQRRTQSHDRLSCWTAWTSCYPCLQVYDDCALSTKVREEMYKCYPNAKRAHLKSGGNFPYLSRPDEVNLYIQVSTVRYATNGVLSRRVAVTYVFVMYVWMHHASGWTRSGRSVVRLIYYVERLRLMCGSSVCTSLRFTWSSLSAPAMPQWNPLLKIL